MKRFIIFTLLISLVIGISSLSVLAGDKFQRVGENAILGWTEIPKAVVQVTKDTDNPFLGITIGILKGIANAFARTTSGVVDLATLGKPELGESAIKPSMVPLSETK